MRVGILGGGNISDTHARAALSISGVSIAAVCARTREKAAALADKYGGAAYDNLDQFLSHRPMDLVAIGSPSGVHADQGIAAVAKGLHVLVEKPIDITTAKADALIAAADAAGVKLGVFFQDRLRPDVARMKTTIEAGKLGRPILVSGRVKWYRPPEYYSGSRWRGTIALDGGGAIINQAIHTLDLMAWMFGPVSRVYGRTATRIHEMEGEDTAVVTFDFESGALGVLEATTSVFPGYARRLEITGSNGTMILEHERLVAVDLRDETEKIDAAAKDDLENVASPVVSDVSAHRRIFEDFLHAITTNGTPACDGREGRRSVALIEAIYASARTGQPVVPGTRPA
jgi:UDP-N-acetyl-2-amino-2-deoxyglucuronate dehydrogenase